MQRDSDSDGEVQDVCLLATPSSLPPERHQIHDIIEEDMEPLLEREYPPMHDMCLFKNSGFLRDGEEMNVFNWPVCLQHHRCRFEGINHTDVYSATRYAKKEEQEGVSGMQMVFYCQQLDRRGIWLDRSYIQRLSEVPYYRQRGWRRRYPALARICKLQEKIKDEYIKEATGLYACPCRDCYGDRFGESEILSEGEPVPGDWESYEPGEELRFAELPEGVEEQ